MEGYTGSGTALYFTVKSNAYLDGEAMARFHYAWFVIFYVGAHQEWTKEEKTIGTNYDAVSKVYDGIPCQFRALHTTRSRNTRAIALPEI